MSQFDPYVRRMIEVYERENGNPGMRAGPRPGDARAKPAFPTRHRRNP